MRSQLESRFNESVVRMIARPGQKASHQALARYCLPCATIRPQVISGG
jgi:hypothetical protein